jgi:hypothetical protein
MASGCLLAPSFEPIPLKCKIEIRLCPDEVAKLAAEPSHGTPWPGAPKHVCRYEVALFPWMRYVSAFVALHWDAVRICVRMYVYSPSVDVSTASHLRHGAKGVLQNDGGIGMQKRMCVYVYA